MLGMRAGDWVVVVGMVGLVVGCGGKSVTEHEGGSGGASTSSGGASTSSGGTTIHPPATGGTGAVGSAGMTSCAQPLDGFAPGCDAPAELRSYCAKGGCHNAVSHAANLDLTPDDFLVARTLNRRPLLTITRIDVGECRPEDCPSVEGTFLIDGDDPEQSWMLAKMAPFVPGITTNTLDMGCGDAMPTFNTTGIASYSDQTLGCLKDFFLAIAANGMPCTPPGSGLVPPSPPVCPPLPDF